MDRETVGKTLFLVDNFGDEELWNSYNDVVKEFYYKKGDRFMDLATEVGMEHWIKAALEATERRES